MSATIQDRWRYYEGTTSANSILKDLAKVLCTAVKTDEIKDANGNVIKEKEIIIEKNWDIVYPKPSKEQLPNIMDWNNLTPSEFLQKIENQLAKVTDTVILKTKTTPKALSQSLQVDDIGLEDDLSIDSIEMYVELYKPTYLVNPEEYVPDCERYGIKPYLITEDIYREYANPIAEKEINFKTLSGSVTGITVKTDNVEKLEKSINIVSSVVVDYFNMYAALYGISDTLTPDSALTYNIISESDREQLKGTALETVICNTLGILPEKLYKYQVITLYFYRNRYDTLGGTFKVTVQREYETYSLNAGIKFRFDEGDKVLPDTVEFKLGNTAQGPDVWTFDRTTYEFKLLKAISGRTETLGEPIITYKYKKEQSVISARKLLYNHHHIYVRMFDKLNDEGNGPKPDIVDDLTGEVLQRNSRVSEWTKLSWYQDFEEVMVDSLDADVGISDVSDGKVFLPVETPGLTGDTRFKFWINTNNDRSIVVLMGNPSLDFGNNRHLISVAYLGQIDSFENSINDTAGNFTLFTSSSTVPCSTKIVKKKIILDNEVIVGVGTGSLSTFNYEITKKDEFFLGAENIIVKLEDSTGNIITLNYNEGFTATISTDKKKATVQLFSPPLAGTNVYIIYKYYIEKYDNIKGVIRDGFGNVIKTIYPDTYGKNTATGVIDIAMYHTRTKAYFQKHHMMFTTTEEYMTKEMYGKSAYTGEYYADRIKITHGNDGPRGMLKDCLAIDTSSLFALDELIVNRNFTKNPDEPEETYVFFPITAPYSPFSGSPNATYGFALKKAVRYPVPVTDDQIVDATLKELDVLVGNLQNLTDDIVLPDSGTYGATVTWASSDTNLIEIQ